MGNQKIYYVERIFAWLLLALAVFSIFTVVFVIFSRIHYPYSLERMEGASLIQVVRILGNQTLYTSPSINYIPLIYPPIYFYLSALVAKILGLNFASLRLVSSFAFAGCLIFIFLMIERVTKDKYLSLIGAGFFAATYPLSGIWFDVARVDTLFVFFCVAAIWFSSREDAKVMFLSGLFWILAIFTKQTGLIAFFFSFGYLLFFHFRRNIIRLVWASLFGIFAYWFCAIVWGKWFSYYVFYLPSFHQLQDNLTDISNSVIQLFLPLLLSIFVCHIPFLLDRELWSKEPIRYFGYMTLVLFGLSLMGRWNLGGYTNVYMPAHAMLAVMLGISLDWWKNKLNFKRTHSSGLYASVAYLLCISQFMMILFDPRSVIPHPMQVEEWSRLERWIAQAEGNVFAPEINYLVALTGKRSFTNQVALDEILGKFGEPEPHQSQNLQLEINQALQEGQFDLVLLKTTEGPWAEVEREYNCFPLTQMLDQNRFSSIGLQEYQACYPINGNMQSIQEED